MPKLVFTNAFSRAMTARPADLPTELLREWDIAAVMLWSLQSDDIAAITAPVDGDFLDYLTGQVGLSDKAPTVLSLHDYASDRWYPRENPALGEQVRDLIASSGHDLSEWTVAPYIHDRDIAHWQRLLGLDSDAAPYAQDLAALVNSKTVFRALAVATGIPVPEGYVVDAGPELLDAVTELLDRAGSVIVKQDQNSGGFGNTVITTDPSVKGFGAVQILRLDQVSDLDAGLRRALHANHLALDQVPRLPPGAAPARFIVEVYHPNSRSLSSEVYIPLAGDPVLRNYGEMRMEPIWNGIILPPQGFPETVHAQFRADSQRIALTAQRLGYHGLLNIDAIVGPDHDLSYNEFNGRAGGVTNIDTIARRLLGEDYLHTHVLLTRNGVHAPRTPVLAEHLASEGIHFDTVRRSGVIIASDNPSTGTIAYVAIGHTHAEAQRLEHHLEAILTQLPALRLQANSSITDVRE